jgi:H+/Cl- antiporter ClcA
VDEAVWCGDGELGFRRSVGTSVLSIVVVGMGVSLGREAAPKLMGAGLALMLELTPVGFGLMAPMVVAVVVATAVARRMDRYSIYSARLSAAQSTISP